MLSCVCALWWWPSVPPAIYSPAYFEVPSSLNFCPPPLYTSVYSLYDWTLIETCARYLRKHSRIPILVCCFTLNFKNVIPNLLKTMDGRRRGRKIMSCKFQLRQKSKSINPRNP